MLRHHPSLIWKFILVFYFEATLISSTSEASLLASFLMHHIGKLIKRTLSIPIFINLFDNLLFSFLIKMLPKRKNLFDLVRRNGASSILIKHPEKVYYCWELPPHSWRQSQTQSSLSHCFGRCLLFWSRHLLFHRLMSCRIYLCNLTEFLALMAFHRRLSLLKASF